MKYWLLKSEPSVYAFADLKRDKKNVWDGIRNYQARNNLRLMKNGDICLFYHSGEDKAVVGIAKVVKEAYPDPKAKGEDWSAVDIAYQKLLNRPVTLTEVKASSVLKNMQLVTHSRLSVQEVKEVEFERIIKMAEAP